MPDVINVASVGFTLIWKIENFSYARQKVGHFLETPVFTVDFLDKTKWCVQLYPAGNFLHSKDTIACYPKKCMSRPYCHTLHHELSFLRADGSRGVSMCGTKSRIHREGKHALFRSETLFGKMRDTLLPGDTLTVQCRMWKPREICSEPEVILARTVICVERKSFVWTVERFSTLVAEDFKQIIVDSSSRRFKPLTITLTMIGGSPFNQSILFEVCRSGGNECNYTTLAMSVLDVNRKAAFESKDEFLFEPSEGQQVWRFPLHLRREKLMAAKDALLPDDVLYLKCDFATSVGTPLTATESISYGCNPNSCKVQSGEDKLVGAEHGAGVEQSCRSLTEDLRHLLDEKSLCDMTIRVCQETFPVHKAILGARSSVFMSMFESDMKEKMTKCIEIEDFKPETVQRLLLYMYTDTLEDIGWEAASRLYSAADKYDVGSLKKRCSSILKEKLTTSNACEVLALADMVDDKGLKRSVQDYIQVNDKEIILSDEWKCLEQENATLALGTVCRMYKIVKEY